MLRKLLTILLYIEAVPKGNKGGFLNYITDAFGLTDSQSGARAVNTLTKMTDDAMNQFDAGVQGAIGNFDLSKQLGDYNSNSAGSVDRINNSGVTPDSASAWLNPKLDLMQDAAARSLGMGGAGSASNNAVAAKVAMLGANEWDKAQQAAFTNSQNEQNIGKTTADIYQQQFENNILPDTFKTQALLDANTARLNSATNAAAGAGQLAGQNRGIMGELASIGSVFKG